MQRFGAGGRVARLWGGEMRQREPVGCGSALNLNRPVGGPQTAQVKDSSDGGCRLTKRQGGKEGSWSQSTTSGTSTYYFSFPVSHPERKGLSVACGGHAGGIKSSPG